MGTHPIFESDFDCLTDKMVKFDDVSKACDDLFKKPFNSGKVNVDIKSGAFTLKNSCKGGAMSSNLEMKMDDALFGMAPNFALPCTKKFDGKKLTFEFAKSFNDLKLAVDTTFPSAPLAGEKVVSTASLRSLKLLANSKVSFLPSNFFVHGRAKFGAIPKRASSIFISKFELIAPPLHEFLSVKAPDLMSTLTLPELNGFLKRSSQALETSSNLTILSVRQSKSDSKMG